MWLLQSHAGSMDELREGRAATAPGPQKEPCFSQQSAAINKEQDFMVNELDPK